MKHIDIKLKFTLNIVKEYNINIKYIPANVQTADLFAKTWPKPNFQNLFAVCISNLNCITF